jgi:hypothetical protein
MPTFSVVQNLFKRPMPNHYRRSQVNLETLCLQQLGETAAKLVEERFKIIERIPAKNTRASDPTPETPPPSTC